jgi:hypothetical protein
MHLCSFRCQAGINLNTVGCAMNEADLTPDLRVSDIMLTATKFVGLSLQSLASLLMSPSSNLWPCPTLSQWLCRLCQTRCPRGRNTRSPDHQIPDNRWDVLEHSDPI